MIGKITLFILGSSMICMLLFFFVSMINKNILEEQIDEIVEAYSEKISMEGVFSRADHEEMTARIKSFGNYEVIYKYSRKISGDIYEISTKPDDLLDRYLDKGDMVNILVYKENDVFINKISYVMVNAQELISGYEVILMIMHREVTIKVRNKGQEDYIEYTYGSSEIYGDDENEQPYNPGYICEYSKYVKREEYNEGELMCISYTEN